MFTIRGFVSYLLQVFSYLAHKLLFINYAKLSQNIAQRTNTFDKNCLFKLDVQWHRPHRTNSLTFTEAWLVRDVVVLGFSSTAVFAMPGPGLRLQECKSRDGTLEIDPEEHSLDSAVNY